MKTKDWIAAVFTFSLVIGMLDLSLENERWHWSERARDYTKLFRGPIEAPELIPPPDSGQAVYCSTEQCLRMAVRMAPPVTIHVVGMIYMDHGMTISFHSGTKMTPQIVLGKPYNCPCGILPSGIFKQ